MSKISVGTCLCGKALSLHSRFNQRFLTDFFIVFSNLWADLDRPANFCNFAKVFYILGRVFHIFMGETNTFFKNCSFCTKKLINVKVKRLFLDQNRLNI